ncbi:TM2 domain containing protein [Histomonas meleagridis]|uniref:TM2 domain containing protein n=1 Tax=Histomonas meleagridis TaxID=135588 RepID=UPI003559FF22|nr:TM2 domain containing protein [Histomonas meleagridis]KAH0796364.1 TM2 domain containing protein [Histomonas meleagridis]
MFFVNILLLGTFCIKNCEDLDEWLLNCSTEVAAYHVFECPKSGFYEINCSSLVTCNGTGYTTRSFACYPTSGKDPATALALSIFLGFLGADRFYLGYYSIGIFKLFTGGFFSLGWFLDIFLIALRILKPAHGDVYKFMPDGNFRVRLPAPIYN